ncbi:MAG: hypothetical protein MZV63_15585 [Marinilabiliales bacterium]|nr:hypothetical protein [Marinilabiliales bacterium]
MMDDKMGAVKQMLKPNAPWINIAQNLAPMNDVMNNQVMRGMNLYRGGGTGTGVNYPWMQK